MTALVDHSVRVPRAADVSWYRLLVLSGECDRLVKKEAGKPRWQASNFGFIDYLPRGGLMIADVAKWGMGELQAIDSRNLQGWTCRQLGRLVIHGSYDATSQTTKEAVTVFNPETDAELHLLSRDFFDSLSFRRPRHRSADAWRAAFAMLAGARLVTQGMPTVPFADSLVGEGLKCRFDDFQEVIWIVDGNHGALDQPFAPQLFSFVQAQNQG